MGLGNQKHDSLQGYTKRPHKIVDIEACCYLIRKTLRTIFCKFDNILIQKEDLHLVKFPGEMEFRVEMILEMEIRRMEILLQLWVCDSWRQ